MSKAKIVSMRSSGGALLAAIMAAFIICFVNVGMISLTLNQCAVIENEINEKEEYYLLKSGMEYANCQLRKGLIDFEGPQIKELIIEAEKINIKILIEKLAPGSISDYKIDVELI